MVHSSHQPTWFFFSKNLIFCKNSIFSIFEFHAKVTESVHLSTLWYDQYSKERYPNYCNGPCYGMPANVYKRIYDMTLRINLKPIEKLDDLILTGVLRAQEKIPMYSAFRNLCPAAKFGHFWKFSE